MLTFSARMRVKFQTYTNTGIHSFRRKYYKAHKSTRCIKKQKQCFIPSDCIASVFIDVHLQIICSTSFREMYYSSTSTHFIFFTLAPVAKAACLKISFFRSMVCVRNLPLMRAKRVPFLVRAASSVIQFSARRSSSKSPAVTLKISFFC